MWIQCIRLPYVFGMPGYSGNSHLLAFSIQYIINFLLTVPALIYMDRWGGRYSMIVADSAMTVCIRASFDAFMAELHVLH